MADIEPAIEQILAAALRDGQSLFALVDTARESTIRQWLLDSGLTHRSLYSGQAALELENFAPYLVHLPTIDEVRTLAQAAWGRSWVVFLAATADFEGVRKHFRKFLMVDIEHDGVTQEVYFRFYDPRVLREYLPTCRPDEWQAFFGPVETFVLEGETPAAVVQFQAGQPPAVTPTTPSV